LLSAEEAQAIDTADDWLFSSQAPTATGTDRLRTAVAVAKVVRDIGVPANAAADRIDNWSVCSCAPPLDDHEIELVFRVAYGLPVVQRDQDIGKPDVVDAVPLAGPEQAQQPAQAAPGRPPETIASAGADDLPAGSEMRLREPEAGTEDRSAIDPAEGGAAPVETVSNASSPARPLSAKERMAKRRAELKRLGLPAKWKGSLKAVTPDSVTPTPPDSVAPPVTPTPPVTLPTVEVAR
jgi:hypothetical protein